MNTDHLVRMANQIAAYYASYPDDEAREGLRGHLRRFWDPRMRERLHRHIEAGGEGLSPLVRAALGTDAREDASW